MHSNEVQARLDLSMSIFLFIGLALMSKVQNDYVNLLDESVQTAQVSPIDVAQNLAPIMDAYSMRVCYKF